MTEITQPRPAAQRVALFRRALFRDIPSFLALMFIIVVATGSIFAQWLAPYDPSAINIAARHLPPFSIVPESGFHLLGTDNLGRDVLSRVMYAGQISLFVGLLGVLVSGVFGTIIGLWAGYARGRTEGILMRIVDLQMSVPFLLLAMIVLFTLGPGVTNVIIVLALVRWPVYARISRSLVLDIGSAPFIDFSKMQGASGLRVVMTSILPNIISPMAVIATLEVARVILAESTLSFLGLGVQAPETSWGLMVAQGRQYITTAPWTIYVPGATIFLVGLSITFLVGWIRNMSDPLLRMKWLYQNRP
ncbi:ABC transporter permease [Paracoccus liaowanqingii]|uniref:ABC transporter permease n=1 Tax=Paracoccus liaowanqingii TaxID=2560053 RepID=A0A4Z1CR99_9RHOB|nr:ABC transporter permease [Paracoccus liaowanqingii]